MLTEESTIQMDTKQHYVFRVDPKANKKQIRDAIEQMFPSIQVVRVNTMNYSGKTKRLGRYQGRRGNWKKAIVTLRDGDKIDLI